MKIIFQAAFAILFLCCPVLADDDTKVVENLIRTSVNSVLDILKDKEMDKDAKKEEVMKLIDPLFDIPLMAKLVLGRRHWPGFDKEERKKFTDLFVKTMQNSYFDKIDLLSDEFVNFDQPVRKKKKFHMLTHIVAKDKRYDMLFKLYRKKDSWRVYDVQIEGISFVKSYGAQYDQFLQKSSVQELLTKMKEKILDIPKELKAKDKENKATESGEKSPP